MDERGPIQVIDGEIDMKFKHTKTAPALIEEVLSKDCYDVRNLSLGDGDIVDFGANEGMFTVWMAKKFPEKTVYAFEPVKETFEILKENIKLNELKNVYAYKCGIDSERYEGAVLIVSKDYSGGSSNWVTFNPEHHRKEVASVFTVEHVLGFMASNMVDKPKIALMKVDVEGAEYDALYAFKEWDRVNKIVIEVHINRRLEFEGRRPDGLITWLGNRTQVHKAVVCPILE